MASDSEKRWLEVSIFCDEAVQEAITNFLFELGCQGCQQMADKVVAYFGDDWQTGELEAQVRSYLTSLWELSAGTSDFQVQISTVPNTDWNAEWKKNFKPIMVSRRFMVKPTWEPLPEQAAELVIEIDPKQAFGTGAHETTQLVLQILEDLDVTGQEVLDVGTGTGILAIAAAMLGANHATAFDIDPVAVEAAEENIAGNIEPGRISLSIGEPGVLDHTKFDLILANITRNVILAVFSTLVAVLKPGGRMILSGILIEELPVVRARISSENFVVLAEKASAEWAAIMIGRG